MIKDDFFTRGVAEIIDEKSLKSKLASGRKLRIKLGVDPTKPDLHLGHGVVLWKLRELQDAGHTIIFLIGDYTTKIGDPSGRNTTRPILTDAEIKANAKTYLAQAGKFLDLNKTEIRYNSEWFKKMTFENILLLAGKFTVAQIIERDDFEKRLKAHAEVSLHEILYPLMQAYDSVMLKADVEFGGLDQKFNMLSGRDLQKKNGQPPQDVFMMGLLVGTDGVIKMSKSVDNYVGITEDPKSMFGKIMSIPDSLILSYFELAANFSQNKILAIKDALQNGQNPRDIKLDLAEAIVTLYHTKQLANTAKDEFINVFSNKELPTDIPEVKIDRGNYDLPLLLLNLGAITSNTEARRLIEQGAVKIDGAKITDPKSPIAVKTGMIIQVGKRKNYKIKAV